LKDHLPAKAAAKHFDSMQVPAFVAKLRARDGAAAAALEFAILTATRTGDVIGARWGEIDLDAGVWTIPGERLKVKGKDSHQVPLSPQAVAILKAMATGAGRIGAGGFVFINGGGKPLSNMAS
jgi:integrase